MVYCIVEADSPRRVILFGSRATGSNHLKPDLDYPVEMDGWLEPCEVMDVAVDARLPLIDTPLSKDSVVSGSKQVQKEPNNWYSAAHHAVEDGGLYARPS